VSETPLTDDAKGAIRQYMLGLLALPVVVVSLVFFVLGFAVRDWAAKTGEVEAFRLAQGQLTPFVDKVTEARIEARRAADETKELRAQAEKLKTDIDLQKAATNSEGIREDVAKALQADTAFVQSLRTVTLTNEASWKQDHAPTDLGVGEGEGVCFITRVIGNFDGEGEEVAVRSVGGRFVLTGQSKKWGVGASARCLKFKPS
jgi:hypothetical protein